jgi:uncharacterized damage-inducible protein DinB
MMRPRSFHLAATMAAACVLGLAAPAAAQTTALDGMRGEFADVSRAVRAAADKAPDAIYGYQPTPEVFTLRKMLLHIADASYSICSGFKGTPGQRPKVDVEAATPKAEVLTTIDAAFAYCDTALGQATDATLAETVSSASGRTRPKSYYVSHLLAHTSLHYGNVVTYLRLNKIAP